MNENLGKFFEELEQNEKAQELLKAECADGTEADYSALARIARKTGYEVTDEEMADFWTKVKTKQAKASEAMAAQIAELSCDEMDQVAGGKDHMVCSDTYKDGENCMWDDVCDKLFKFYYYEDDKHNCESNTFCEGLLLKRDCKNAGIGF